MEWYGELKVLVENVASRVDRWTTQQAWTFEPGSPAAAEIANAEVRKDGAPWGGRPVHTAYAYAQMAVKQTVELSRCAALLIGAARPAPGIEVLVRAALEAGSVAWWMLEEKLSARERVCRMQLLRRNSAREHAKSIKEVDADPAIAGKETVAGIEAECRDLGLAAFTQRGNNLEGQLRLGYTERAKAMTDELGYQGTYSIYSSVAHAELAGVWRLFGETGATVPAREPLYGAVANPRASLAATDGALKSLMGPMERVAFLFGWTVPGRGDEISQTIDYINSEMTRLRR